MLKLIKRIDADTAQTILLRLLSVGTGGLTILIIPHALTRIEQGYYYTILSLLALQIFFELGFNYVLIQISGSEFAKLQVGAEYALTGERKTIGRMVALYKLVKRWYLIASVAFLVVVWVGGMAFFGSDKQGSAVDFRFSLTWTLCVVAAAANLFVSPFLAIVEGAGNVAAIARMRLAATLVGYTILWVCFALGFGLISMVSVPLTLAVSSVWWLKNYPNVLHALHRLRHTYEDTLNWRTEIFPFQWKISASWIGGYLLYQMFNPFIFMRHGAVEAGRIGMSMAIFTAVQNVGMSWVSAKFPLFASLVSLNRTLELKRLFGKTLARSLISTGVMCMMVLGGVYLTSMFFPSVLARIAAPSVLSAIAVATMANNFVFGAATFMRSFREEPMVLPTLICALIVVSGIYFGSLHSAALPIYIYATVSAAVLCPWTLILLRQYYRREPVADAVRCEAVE